MRRSYYLVIILLLIAQTSFGQIYQNMAQPGYKFSRARFDSVLTIPTGLGGMRNISGGRDTGQIRFNLSDSSVYVWNGRRWVKPIGGGVSDTLKVSVSDTAAMLLPYAKVAALAGYQPLNSLSLGDVLAVGNDAGGNRITNLIDPTSETDATNKQYVDAEIGRKLNKTDTAAMLTPYARTSAVALKLNITDTAAMLAPYTRVTVSSYGKNATRDSTILLLSNGTRYAAKDSVGSGGGASGWSLTGNASAVTDFLGTTNNRTMRFRTNNVERMVIDSTGKVGIGTATPTFLLDVNGTARVTGATLIDGFTNPTTSYLSLRDGFVPSAAGGSGVFAKNNAGGSADGLGLHGSDGISLNTNATERMLISQTGLISFPNSTTLAATTFSSSALVNGILSLDAFTNPTTSYIALRNGFAPTTSGGSGFNAKNHKDSNADGLGIWGMDGISFQTNTTERGRFTADGNLLVGTTTDVASSKLTIESTTQGVLFPRMTLTQRNAIASPAAGLQVYNTDANTFDYYNGSAWGAIGGGGGGVTTMSAIGSIPNANGASISGSTLTLQPASVSFGGVVTTAAQTFSGLKTLDAGTGGTLPSLSGYEGLILKRNTSSAHGVNLSLIGGSSGPADIFFGTSTTQNLGKIGYSFTSNQFTLGTIGTTRLTIDANNATLSVPIVANNNSASSFEVLTAGNSNSAGASGLVLNSNTGVGFFRTYGSTFSPLPALQNNTAIGSNSGALYLLANGDINLSNTSLVPILIGKSTSKNVLIGTSTDVASSILTLESTTKGVLFPRMTTVQKLAIVSPAAGLQVYDTTLNQMSYYNGTTWINF